MSLNFRTIGCVYVCGGGVGGWLPFILQTPLTFKVKKSIVIQWPSYFIDILPYLESRNSTIGFSNMGHGAVQANILRGKQSSLSVFHIVGLLEQIDNIWKTDKKN